MIFYIPLPEHSKCLLKLGQKVDYDTPFIESQSQSQISIPIAKKLNIPSENIFRYLKKFVGDSIKKGELLAVKKSVFSTNKIYSEYEGIIRTVNHENGDINISIDEGEKNTLSAYFQGEVIEINRKEVKIKVLKGKDFEIKYANFDFGGNVIYLNNQQQISYTDLAKKILVTESINDYLQTKSEALGIEGFVTLTKLALDTDLPFAVLKNKDDFKIIAYEKNSHCFVNKTSSKIYFYA